MNTQESVTYLYIIMGVIIGFVVISGVALLVLKLRRNTKRSHSAESDGSDSSEFAEMFAEKLRNERSNHRK